MPDVAEALYAKAGVHSGLLALLGNPPRLQPQLATQRTAQPYVVYTIISDPPSHRMRSDKDAWARVQFECWDTSPALARLVAGQVVACFDRWTPGDYATVPIRGAICDDRGRDVGYDDITTLYGHAVELRVMHGLVVPVTVAVSGTALAMTEADVVAGGRTIILTVTGDIWLPAGVAFNGIRQTLINGMGSAQGEPTGWNSVVSPAIPVGNVARTSDTVVTVILPAVPSYNITAPETISAGTLAGVLLATGARQATPFIVVSVV